MPNIIQVTPFMLVAELDAALDFMTAVLGFGSTSECAITHM